MRGEPLLPWLLVLTGAVGLVASGTLMVERVRLLEDPTYVPMCTLNSVFSCGSVMTSSQASVFGFPNPLLGVAGFALVLAIGAGMLAGAAYRHWFWRGLQAGVTFAIVFVHWLMFQTVFRVEALCPYCMVVWAVTVPLFWYVTLANVQAEAKGRETGAGTVVFLQRYHSSVLALWYLLVATLLLGVFWL